MRKVKKIFNVINRKLIKLLNFFNTGKYMKKYLKYLRKLGIKINGTPKYIDPSVYFDGADYTKIELGDNITISREVMFLTHDYSITTALALKGINIERSKGEYLFIRGIKIGNHTFIGARVSLLPGTEIGNNVIVGAGSVVRGRVPDNSIVAGNPAQVIGKTSEWIDKKYKSEDFYVETKKGKIHIRDYKANIEIRNDKTSE